MPGDQATSAQRERRACRQQLESLARAGVTHLPKPSPTVLSETPDSFLCPSEEAAVIQPDMAAGFVAASAGADSLAIIAAEVAACTRCSELAATRTQTVPGVGNPNPRLVFLGEAPGADEDRRGEPFVGRAGQLLTQIIENGMGLKRSDVFILNILKCRPPGNRNPLPQEAANCREYLDRQLVVLKPEFLCCLGSVAAQNLLATDSPIGRMRGKFFDYRGIRVMCTYHPAYLLRNPAAKKDAWADIQMLMEAMGMPVETRRSESGG